MIVSVTWYVTTKIKPTSELASRMSENKRLWKVSMQRDCVTHNHVWFSHTNISLPWCHMSGDMLQIKSMNLRINLYTEVSHVLTMQIYRGI